LAIAFLGKVLRSADSRRAQAFCGKRAIPRSAIACAQLPADDAVGEPHAQRFMRADRAAGEIRSIAWEWPISRQADGAEIDQGHAETRQKTPKVASSANRAYRPQRPAPSRRLPQTFDRWR